MDSFSKILLPSMAILVIAILVMIILEKPIEKGTFTISDKEFGEDCSNIGTWDDNTKTCTLNNKSKSYAINMESSGITLDGNGHTIKGDGQKTGIKIFSQTGITIKNLKIENFHDGILLEGSSYNTFTNLEISKNTRHGIFLKNNSNNNTISFNFIGESIPTTFEINSSGHGIRIDDSQDNTITNNKITKTKDAIRLKSSNHNTITKNDIFQNRVEGIDFHSSEGNKIFFNNIDELVAIPILSTPSDFSNDFFISEGGNYYTNFDEPSEGCTDQNLDNFCDEPYLFTGGTDSLAFVKQNGWEK